MISSQILSQFLCLNKYIKSEDTAMHFPKFSNKDTNFISELSENGRIISWVNLKDKHESKMTCFLSAIPARWRKTNF